MAKLFGTDGIRGKANVYPVTPEMAMRLGKAIALVLGQGGRRQRAIIGKDTRLSGYMLETALASGLVSMGMDVYLVGPVPTPALAHFAKSMQTSAGLMITASHNPAEDNGIKIFDGQGFKLPDEVEEKIEALLLSGEELVPADPAKMGKAFRIDDAGGRYIEFAKNAIDNASLDGLKVVMDCAHGAAYWLSPMIFKELGCELTKLSTAPDGLNINDNCGALHPEHMAAEVVKRGAQVGVAFDGDADRVIIADEKGNIVDGDRIIAMLALDMKRRGVLKNNAVAVTSMTNLGFHDAMKKAGIRTVVTGVGDRYVIEAMREQDLSIGGEQSGHIILSDVSTTGDGSIAALRVLRLMKESGKPLSELAECMSVYPQLLTNLKFATKRPLDEMPALQSQWRTCEAELGDSGRIVIRWSGTESKLRILVEAKSQAEVDSCSARLADAAKKDLG
ncbi:MAG: hypothetical protein RL095_2330 [Verrucomicrobiota bacterium]|jgi:phosphoglucosamine mutase